MVCGIASLVPQPTCYLVRWGPCLGMYLVLIGGALKQPKLENFGLKVFPKGLRGAAQRNLEGQHFFLLFSLIFFPPPHINNVHNSKLKNLKYYAGRKLKKTIFRPLQPKQATQLL